MYSREQQQEKEKIMKFNNKILSQNKERLRINIFLDNLSCSSYFKVIIKTITNHKIKLSKLILHLPPINSLNSLIYQKHLIRKISINSYNSKEIIFL